MPLVNPTLPNDGESADAGDISQPFLELLQVFNGHIGADNLEPGTIPASLGTNSVTTAMINEKAITKEKIGDGAISPDKVAPAITLAYPESSSVFTPLITSRMNLLPFTKASTIGTPTGTPQDGQTLVLRLRDNGTGWGITWNAIFRGIGLTLPTSTGGNNVYVSMLWNAPDSKWDVVSVARAA